MTMGCFTLWAAAPSTTGPRTCGTDPSLEESVHYHLDAVTALGAAAVWSSCEELCHAPGHRGSLRPWERLGDGYFSIARPGADWYHPGLRFVCDSWSSDGGGREQALPTCGLEGLWTNLSLIYSAEFFMLH